MTKDEIKRVLDDMGVEYGKDAKLAELETLYASHATESQTRMPTRPKRQPRTALRKPGTVPTMASSPRRSVTTEPSYRRRTA